MVSRRDKFLEKPAVPAEAEFHPVRKIIDHSNQTV